LSEFREIEEQELVLFLGFPFYLKGVDVLLEAFLGLAGRFPQWRLLLVGHDLERHAARWLPHPQVEVRKAVFRHQVPEILGRCAMLVLPSRSEARGRVLIEAAACGKARIATSVGGSHTVISHGHDGILVPPENVAALSQALEELMSNPARRAQLGAAAKERACSDFSVETWLRNLDELVTRCEVGRNGG
jgi:glycosyltransferase involved in cell wall biosynthesis